MIISYNGLFILCVIVGAVVLHPLQFALHGLMVGQCKVFCMQHQCIEIGHNVLVTQLIFHHIYD